MALAQQQLVSSDDNLHLTHATPLEIQPAICRLVHLQLTSSPAMFHAILCSGNTIYLQFCACLAHMLTCSV